MANKKTFSIVVPVYQNEANLDDTIPKLLSLQESLSSYNLELVFVDDGSTDKSFEVLLKYQLCYPAKIKIVKLTKNFGQTPATQVGLREADGDCIGIISADLQDPYELFATMVAKWETGTKLVIAEREKREEGKWHSFISGLYWKMINRYAIKDFPIGGFDFCLMDKKVRDDIVRINEKNTSIFPLIFSLGYDYDILPFTRKLRSAGKSQWTFSKKVKLTIDTFVGFTYLPVRIISLLGIITSIATFLYSLLIFLRWLILGSTVAGWTTIAILVSMLGGLILLSLGIISEYLWRILDETRKRPNFVIDRVIENKKGE